MGVQTVPYYIVACEACGIHTLMPREQASAAVDRWVDRGGVVLTDGRAYCNKHKPSNFYCHVNRGPHGPVESGVCLLCGLPLS